MDQTIAMIRDVSGQSLQEKTNGAPLPILLALSGGFDSRLIAALCHDRGIPIRALSHGRRHNKESHSATAVARVLGLDLETLPQHKDATLRDLPVHLQATEGTADPAALSIMNLFGAQSAPGSALLHGLCSFHQEGHINHFDSADYASHETLAEAILRRYYPCSRGDLSGLFNPAPDLDEVRQDVLDGLNADCPPHQAYVLWQQENRVRRYVGSQFAVLGTHFDTIMPFYDRRLFGIWDSIAPVGLANRAVLRTLLARYYPALARIPHSEQAAPIIPNLRWQLKHFYHRLPRTLLATAIGEKRKQAVFLRLYRHDDIMTLSKLAAPQQRAYMLSQLAHLQPALKQALGVQLSPDYKTILSDDLQALRAIFTVASYAQGRCNTEHPARTTALHDTMLSAAGTVDQ